jgi:hypothetical protein
VTDRAHMLDDLGALYHSYRIFGVDNPQIVNFATNQRCKEAIIVSYMLYAIAKSRERADDPVSFAELFCADGYFTMLARSFGAFPAVGIDSNRDGHTAIGPAIAARLGIDVRFELRDVGGITDVGAYDVVANIGGLYHVSNPIETLKMSYDLAKRFLIVQTVVSMANQSEDYFQAPAPGLQHGSRFSRAWFRNALLAQGYDVLDEHFNLLEGNGRPDDMGSVYFLVRK